MNLESLLVEKKTVSILDSNFFRCLRISWWSDNVEDELYLIQRENGFAHDIEFKLLSLFAHQIVGGWFRKVQVLSHAHFWRHKRATRWIQHWSFLKQPNPDRFLIFGAHGCCRDRQRWCARFEAIRRAFEVPDRGSEMHCHFSIRRQIHRILLITELLNSFLA